jgi:hypothetical protein
MYVLFEKFICFADRARMHKISNNLISFHADFHFPKIFSFQQQPSTQKIGFQSSF